jgi:hypothetical protein
MECTEEHAQLMIDQGIFELLSRKLFVGKDWNGDVPENFCLRFYAGISTYKCGADAIRSLDKPEFLMKLIESPGLEKIYGTIIAANVYGKDEKSANTKALLASDRNILDRITCILDYSIHPTDESAANLAQCQLFGFPYGIIGLKQISCALKNLSISDENKTELVKHPKLLDFSCEAILSYLSNNPHYSTWTWVGEATAESSAGGGGSDLDSFENFVEFLLQLSFYFEEDEPLRAHFKKYSFDVKAVMESIVDLPVERNCPFESKQFANLLLKRLEPQPVTSAEKKEQQSEEAATKKKISNIVNEVASDLWYPLWQMNQVEQTAKAIADLVGERAKQNGSSSGLDFPSPIATKPPTLSATATAAASAVTPTATPTAAVTGSASSSRDYEAAWKILNEPK